MEGDLSAESVPGRTTFALVQGPLPAGMPSVAFGAALVRAVNTFDDVGRSLRAARRAPVPEP